MKKALAFVVLGVALGVAVKRVFSQMGDVDWEQRIEAMPDNAPPKWMFRNIAATRRNTDRILELLERESDTSGPSAISVG